jgi:hypothetical protein
MSFQKLPLLLSSDKSMQPVLLGLLNGTSPYPMSGEAELCSESCISLSKMKQWKMSAMFQSNILCHSDSDVLVIAIFPYSSFPPYCNMDAQRVSR